MSNFSLELKGIVKRFGHITALENTDLKVKEGEFFFLLGPSGCGKTTLLKIIGGLEEATEGTVMIMGKDVTFLRANKRNTATVFQEWALFPLRQLAASGRHAFLSVVLIPRPRHTAQEIDLPSTKKLAATRLIYQYRDHHQ